MLKVGSNSVVARMQAGLQLKNQLTSKDPNVKLQFQQRWLQIPEDVKTVVKMNVSTVLDFHVICLASLQHCLVLSFCLMLSFLLLFPGCCRYCSYIIAIYVIAVPHLYLVLRP